DSLHKKRKYKVSRVSTRLCFMDSPRLLMVRAPAEGSLIDISVYLLVISLFAFSGVLRIRKGGFVAKMLAVVNYSSAPDSVELREIDIPNIGPDDILLKVGAVGVCGSDVHQWKGQHSWKVKYPCVLGHEFCGTIAAKGNGVQSVEEGDRVA